MKALSRAAHWLFVVFVVAGCASSNVTAYQPYQGKIARPDRIIVYDFVATPSELPPEVAIAGQGATPPPLTAAQLATGRKLGAEIAKDLVAELQTMGLPAVGAVGQPGPRVGDGLVVGYFALVDPGSATERVALGFGAGGAELKTVVKGFLMTAQGLRALGSGEVEAGSGKMPGGAVPLVVTVATANPLGLVVAGAAKAYGEASGSETIEGAAQRTAREIADKNSAYSREAGVDLSSRMQGRSMNSSAPAILADAARINPRIVAESGEPPRRAAIDRRRLQRYLQQEWQVARTRPDTQARGNDEEDTWRPALIRVRRDCREDASMPPFRGACRSPVRGSNRRVSGGSGPALCPPGH